MFLQIKINDSTLDLYENTKAKFNYKNPAFGKGGGRSLPFTIPKSAHNVQLCGDVDRLDVSAPQKVENASIWLDGLIWDVGVIKMRAASERSIEVYFEGTHTDILKELDSVLIRNVTGNVSVGSPQWTIFYDFLDNGNTYYAIEIDGVQYGHTMQGAETVYNVMGALKASIDVAHPGMATILNNGFELSGTEHHIIQVVTSVNISVISQTLYEDAVVQAWTAYLSAANSDDLIFPVVANWGLFANNPIWQGYINNYQSGAYLIQNTYQSLPTSFNYSIAPFVLLSKVWTQLETDFNFQFAGTFMNSADIQGLFFVHNQTIDNALLGMVSGNTYINAPLTTFDTSSFIPEMTAKELMEHFMEFFCLAFFWDEVTRSWTPRPRADLLATSVEDWTDKAAKAYKFDVPVKKGYRLAYLNDKNDTTSNVVNQPIVVGDGESVYDLVFASPEQRGMYIEGLRQMPYLHQLNTGEFSPRWATYQGLQPSSTGVNYPQALCFAIEDVYADYWEDWANFLNNAKKLNKVFDLDINDLLKLRTFEEPMKFIQSEAGSVVGMVSGFSFEAGVKGMGFVDVEIYTRQLTS